MTSSRRRLKNGAPTNGPTMAPTPNAVWNAWIADAPCSAHIFTSRTCDPEMSSLSLLWPSPIWTRRLCLHLGVRVPDWARFDIGIYYFRARSHASLLRNLLGQNYRYEKSRSTFRRWNRKHEGTRGWGVGESRQFQLRKWSKWSTSKSDHSWICRKNLLQSGIPFQQHRWHSLNRALELSSSPTHWKS